MKKTPLHPIAAQHKSNYRRDLLDWRKTEDVAGIRIIRNERIHLDCTCEIAGCYRLKDAPAYPFSGCKEEICGCWWECIFDDEAEGIEWKVPVKRHSRAGRKINIPEEPLTEERVRKLASVVSKAFDTPVREADIQTMLVNSGLRKQKGILERLRGWFAKFA